MTYYNWTNALDLMRRVILQIAYLSFLLLFAVATTAAEPQVTGLGVSHRSGQTFITWKEVDPPRLDKNCDDAAFLRKYPEKEIGFITWSNGKNDSGIGWPQAVEFYQAMQQTRRPHIFVWGLSGHGQRASMPADAGERIMPIDIRLDRSLPAFTNCSLDNDPGTAARLKEPKEVTIGDEKNKDTYDGDPTGQVNLYLYWRSEDIVDTPDSWEMTVGLTDTAPKNQCTVDITPRRLQNFKPKPKTTYKWTNSSDGKVLQQGKVIADRWGFVTIPKVTVGKKTNRIAISKKPD